MCGTNVQVLIPGGIISPPYSFLDAHAMKSSQLEFRVSIKGGRVWLWRSVKPIGARLKR